MLGVGRNYETSKISVHADFSQEPTHYADTCPGEQLCEGVGAGRGLCV